MLRNSLRGVLILLTLVSCSGLATAAEVPIKGDWAGKTVSAVPTDNPGVLFITTAGSGHVSHLGKCTMVSPHFAELATGKVIGMQIFTAANGDTLVASIIGQFTPTPDGTLTAQLQATIIGGTGRFQAAQGGFVFDIVFNPATFESYAMIDGEISMHGK